MELFYEIKYLWLCPLHQAHRAASPMDSNVCTADDPPTTCLCFYFPIPPPLAILEREGGGAKLSFFFWSHCTFYLGCWPWDLGFFPLGFPRLSQYSGNLHPPAGYLSYRLFSSIYGFPLKIRWLSFQLLVFHVPHLRVPLPRINVEFSAL